MRLLERDDSLLVVIDAQPGFTPADPVVARIAWLTGIASAFGVPVVITEEDPARNGPTAPEILARVPAGTVAHVKPVFGLADVPAILETPKSEDMHEDVENLRVLRGLIAGR